MTHTTERDYCIKRLEHIVWVWYFRKKYAGTWRLFLFEAWELTRNAHREQD